MAGIGFSLRKILKHDSITRTIAAYTVAGIIGGGPWLVSIFGIVILSILVSFIPGYRLPILQFQTSVTYITAGSLILSGCVANSFSRYMADQLFLNRTSYVIPNLNGMMLLVTLVSGWVGFIFIMILFPTQDIVYRFLLMGSFVVLSNIWVVITLLTALKNYSIVLVAFFISYFLILSIGYGFRELGLDAFMFGFLFGQIVLLLILLIALYREYPTNTIIDFHFLKKGSMYKILIVSGFLFNLAVWIDKFIFWFYPYTSREVIGPFRVSVIYDMPIFLAYLCLLPGMAVFILLIETNFSDYYARFNDAIRNGKSLSYISITSEQVAAYAANVISSIIKIQAIVIILVFQFGERLLTALNISLVYYNLLYIAVIGTSLQVVLLAIIDILYFMDKRWYVYVLSAAYLLLNVFFTLLTIYLGPFYYGFGFTAALAVVDILGMYFLTEEFSNLEYKVIMLGGE